MKLAKNLLISIIIILMFAVVWAGRRAPIKNVGALLSQARIEMRANPPRYESALEYLDTVLALNGPTPEAYYHKGNILGEFANREYDLHKKIDLFKEITANYDSMFASCDDKEIDKKWKKDCKKFIDIVDSIKVYYWKESYNEGVATITRIDEDYLPGVQNAADSTQKAVAKEALNAAADTSKLHFLAALAIDSSDYRPKEGIGIVYDRLKQYDSSATWFLSALKVAPDSVKLIQEVAYAYIQAYDWDNSIIYFKKLLEKAPNDVATLQNIAICYNNKEMYDSLYAYDVKVINIDSTIPGPYIDVGQYFLYKSQSFSDSIMYYQKANDSAKAHEFLQNRDNNLDSAAFYFKGGLAFEPDNILALEQYSVVSLVRGKYAEAEKGFKRLTELEPDQKTNWINLGDTYIQEQKFEESIAPFEKATEIDPGDAHLWETLADLYESNKMPEKAKNARAKAKELRNM